MKKIIFIFLFLSVSAAIAQFLPEHSGSNLLYNSNEKEITAYKKSFSVNLAPAVFIPVKYFNQNTIGSGLNIGLQYNYSENKSLCLDFDLAYAKRKYGNIVSDTWVSYMLLEFGPKFYLQRDEKLDIFATPEIGVIFSRNGGKNYGNESKIPLCISFEVGVQYKLMKNLSALLKIKNNIQIIATAYNTDLNDFLLINGGLSYQF